MDSPEVKVITKPLEEAPFRKYLEILRENGHKQDADLSEAFYIELLTTPFEDGNHYTVEQLMETPFRDLVSAAELIMGKVTSELNQAMGPISANGPLMVGPDADKLAPEQLRILAQKQVQGVEEEKQRILSKGGYRFG